MRRKGPQFVMPRTTPPWASIRFPAVRAILQGKKMLILRAWELEHFQWRGVGALFDFVGVVWSAYPNLVIVSMEYLKIEYFKVTDHSYHLI